MQKMMYKVIWEDTARDDLRRLDTIVARKIFDKVSSYLARDPEHLGVALSGDLSGLMRYRIGDYRVIYEIHRAEITITMVKIGHRREIYK